MWGAVSLSVDLHVQAAAAPATSASAPAASGSQQQMQVVDGKFTDFRWKSGGWDVDSDAFKKDGKTNWDLVSPLAIRFPFRICYAITDAHLRRWDRRSGACLLASCLIALGICSFL